MISGKQFRASDFRANGFRASDVRASDYGPISVVFEYVSEPDVDEIITEFNLFSKLINY